MNKEAITNLEQTDSQSTEVIQPHEPADTQSVNWDDVNTALDVVEVEGDVEVLEEPVAAEVVAATPVAPASVVEPAAYAPPQPVAPAPPTPQQTAERKADELAKLEQLYALSEEDSAGMFTEPDKVLPKLLARMHQQAAASVLDSMQTAVPQIVQSTSEATRVETEARQAFFSVNDDLAKPEFEAAVLQIGAMYRQVNPHAPKAEAIQKIGELTRVALNLPAKGVAVAATSVAKPANAPFTPSRGGTGGAKAAGPKGTWEQLNAEFDESDGF